MRPLVNLGHTQRGGVPTPPTTACSASATASMPSIWFTTRSGAASPFPRHDITDITIKEAIASNRRLDQRSLT